MSQPIAFYCENAFGVEVVIYEMTHELLEIVATCGNPALACLICILALNDLILSNIDVFDNVHDLFFWRFHALNQSHDSPNICHGIFAKARELSLNAFVVAIGVHFSMAF